MSVSNHSVQLRDLDAVFSSIENGIYCAISISAAILIFRMLKAKGRFLGHVKVHSVVGDHIIGDDTKTRENAVSDMTRSVQSRSIYILIDHNDGSNPDIEVRSPYDGIFIYRFSEGFNYPNANHYLDHLTNHIFANTRRTNPNSYPKLGDQPWNDPEPRRGQPVEIHSNQPTLKAIILDLALSTMLTSRQCNNSLMLEIN